MNTKTVCVLGEGAWGTAVALLLADNGYTVHLWCHHPEVAEEIKAHRSNSRYLPGFTLPATISATTDIKHALASTQWIFEAIPVKYLRSVLEKAHPFIMHHHTWVILSKGIEQRTLMVPSNIIIDVFKQNVDIAIVTGPNFAHEVARKKLTATTVASKDSNVLDSLSKMLANSYFNIQKSSDVIGTQFAAAYKNVIALCIGMLDGAQYTDNTKAACLTYGLQEMSILIKVVGGEQETAYGLAGVGDLVLTSMGSLSRNMQVGQALGKGESLDDIIQRTGYTPEGVNTVVSLRQLAQELDIELPLCRSVYEVIYNNKSIKHMIEDIMQ